EQHERGIHAVSQPGGSRASAACRSAWAIRSRALTFRASSTSSENRSRNGVKSVIPGSPSVLVTRLALAPWAVRRACSARWPATRSLSRVVLARLRSWLAGVSGLAPGCASSDIATTPRPQPGPHDVFHLHGDHLLLSVPIILPKVT